MRFLIWFLIMVLPMASMIFGPTKLEQLFQHLETVNAQREPIRPIRAPTDSFTTSATKHQQPGSAKDAVVSPTLMELHTNDSNAPPPCFVYREPGTQTGEIICTRLPWMDAGR